MKGFPLQGWGCEFRVSVPWSKAASPEVQCWHWEAAVFWVLAFPGSGNSSPAAQGLGLGLFVELEQQAAGPNHRSHSWSSIPGSVWVALIR